MSKQQQFGLNFFKWVNPTTGSIQNFCQKGSVDIHSHLQILTRFNAGTTQFLINEIINAENHQPYDSNPISEGYDDESIKIIFPNIVINDVLTISESEFKELLQEWLTFIS